MIKQSLKKKQAAVKSASLFCSCLLLFLQTASIAYAQEEMSPQENEESAAEPDGRVERLILRGNVEKQYSKKGGNYKKDKSKADSLKNGHTSLSGDIAAESSEDENITINWHRWRNKVSKAVWAKFCVLLAGGDAMMMGNLLVKLGDAPAPHFPLGTRASYTCDIENNRQLKNIRITKSSGNNDFDELVRQSVASINGKQLLKFPKQSKRRVVSVSCELFTTKNGRYSELPFTDLETYKVSSAAGH